MANTLTVIDVVKLPLTVIGLPFAAVFMLADAGKKVCQMTYAKVESLLYKHGYGKAWEMFKHNFTEIATERIAYYVYEMAEMCMKKAIEITKTKVKQWLLEAAARQQLALPID